MCQNGGVSVKLNISGAKLLEHFKRFLPKVSSFDFGLLAPRPLHKLHQNKQNTTAN
jgi:hypothetical protein